MLERNFQAKLIKSIKSSYPDCVVLKNDPNYLQGFPDLTIFYRNKYAVLETKRSRTADHQPNQDYYVGKMDQMSFSRFIFPENCEEVLQELERFFEGD